jgi:hypothetical protein
MFWGESILTAAYIRNRCPTSRHPSKTPHELFHSVKPDISHLRTFGCPAFVHIDSKIRTKWDSKAIEGIFVGYGINVKGYRIYIPTTSKVITSIHVTFHESLCNSTDDEPTIINNPIDSNELNDDTLPKNSDEDDKVIQNIPNTSNEPTVTRSGRTSRPPVRLSAFAFIASTINRADEPATYNAATNSQHASEWTTAISTELSALSLNNTFSICTLPPGRKAIGSKWVFTTKRDNNGVLIKRKARLTAQGFSQIEHLDFTSTFAPVARSSSLRLLLSLANSNDYEIRQLDFSNAFLNSTLKEEIYMKIPKGYPGHYGPDSVLRLHKGLYGLKQSNHEWHQLILKELLSLGFHQSISDNCVFWIRGATGHVVYILCHVDDFLLLGPDLATICHYEQ